MIVKSVARRRRVKVGATIDPDLLHAVDTYVAGHPGSDRSKVIDEALRLWQVREQERAMTEQFNAPDDVDPQEWEAWKSLQRAAAQRLFRSRDAHE